MQKYQVNDDVFVILDGELYLKVKFFAKKNPEKPLTFKIPKKRGPKPGGHKTRAKLLEQEDLKHIKEMINAGYKAAEIAQKFDVTAQYVYNIKLHMKKKGELTLTEELNV